MSSPLPSTSDPPLTPLSPRHSHPACAQRVAGVRFGRGHFRCDLREKKTPSMTRDAFDRFDLGRNPRRPLERPLHPRTSPRDFAVTPTSPTSHHRTERAPFAWNGPCGLGPRSHRVAHARGHAGAVLFGATTSSFDLCSRNETWTRSRGLPSSRSRAPFLTFETTSAARPLRATHRPRSPSRGISPRKA